MAATGEAAHLDDAVRGDLRLPDDLRIARLDRDRWIGYGRAHDAFDGLARILRSERRQRPDNLLVIGASNNGKTAIARRFLSRATLPENPAAQHSIIPVAMIQAPNGPRVPQLFTAIRAALGHPPGRRETTAQLRLETYRMMQAVHLRLLLIDDLHDISGSRVSAMLVQLREIGSVAGVSLGCFATREIAHVLRQDDQLANRFELMTLPRWRIEDPDVLAPPPYLRAAIAAAVGLQPDPARPCRSYPRPLERPDRRHHRAAASSRRPGNSHGPRADRSCYDRSGQDDDAGRDRGLGGIG